MRIVIFFFQKTYFISPQILFSFVLYFQLIVMNRKKWNRIEFLMIFLSSISISFISIISNTSGQNLNVNLNDQISMEYYTQPGCSSCEEKEIYVNSLVSNHTSLNYTKINIIYGTNHSEFFEYTKTLGLGTPGTPLIIFNKGGCFSALAGSNITYNNLEAMYSQFAALEGECSKLNPGSTPDDSASITPTVAFISGLITGLSPCVILVTAVISSTLVIQDNSNHKKNESQDPPIEDKDNEQKEGSGEEKIGNEEQIDLQNLEPKKIQLFSTFSGFLLGVLLMYILLAVALITTIDLIAETFFGSTLRIIFAIIMFILGGWYIIDAFNENSKLFKTPDSIKRFVKKFSAKGGFGYSFALGFIFSFLKVPCVGAIMLALVYGLAANPSTFVWKMSLFFIGLLIPLLILMLILGLGVKSKQIDKIRIKYRPLLRIISGGLIIGLTIYTLFFLE
jgi:cytochrome c biogenesis protein CcdA